MSQKQAVLGYLRNTPLFTSYPDWAACADSIHILISRPDQKDVELLLFFDQVGYSFRTKCCWHVCLVKPEASLEDCDWSGPSGCCVFLPLYRALLVNNWVLSKCVVSEYFMIDKKTRMNSSASCPVWPRKCSLETVRTCSLPIDSVNLRLSKAVFTTAANLSSFYDRAL